MVSVDGQPVVQWADLLTIIERSPGRELRVGLGRATGRTEVTVTPESTTVSDSARYGQLSSSTRPSAGITGSSW